MVSKDMDKGKGTVIDFTSRESDSKVSDKNFKDQKLLSSAFQAGLSISRLPLDDYMQYEGVENNFQKGSFVLQEGSSIYRTGFSDASSSGIKLGKPTQRKRPYKSRRKPTAYIEASSSKDMQLNTGIEKIVPGKRKALEQSESSSKSARIENQGMVPKEGPSNH